MRVGERVSRCSLALGAPAPTVCVHVHRHAEALQRPYKALAQLLNCTPQEAS